MWLRQVWSLLGLGYSEYGLRSSGGDLIHLGYVLCELGHHRSTFSLAGAVLSGPKAHSVSGISCTLAQ